MTAHRLMMLLTILALSHICPPTSAHSVDHRLVPMVSEAPPATRHLTPPSAAAAHRSVASQVEELTRHPAAWDDDDASAVPVPLSARRKKLKPHHLPLFSSTSLFDQFASTICETGAVARKEVFETWAAALYIDARFQASRRVVDVAAGHGLLAWALLLIDDDRRQRQVAVAANAMSNQCTEDGAEKGNLRPPRTALCVDRRMTPAAVKIESAMLDKYPHLVDKFHYVEGSLEQLVPHASSVLASVHACAGLSDLLVGLAARHAVPLAVVPCCHSRKMIDRFASDFAREEYDAIIQDAADGMPMPDLADRLDGARMAALRNAGFDVYTVTLPRTFTAKNRLILASPPSLEEAATVTRYSSSLTPTSTRSTSARERPRSVSSSNVRPPRPGRMAPLIKPPPSSSPTEMTTAKARFLARMSIPCEDSPKSRAAASALSGKIAAERRRRALHVRGNRAASSPTLDVSVWLPPDLGRDGDGRHDDDEDDDRNSKSNGTDNRTAAAIITDVSLSSLGSSIDAGVRCAAVQLGPDFVNSAGRRAKTFRLTYSADGGSLDVNEKTREGVDTVLAGERARAVHEEVCRRIPTLFPGTVCR